MSDNDEITKKARTLVLCFDGTSNEYDGDNTNVVKFFSLLKKDDFNEQLCYYQAGVGTFFAPGVVSPIYEWFAKILDEAVAWYLNAQVMDGYRFVMENYRVGDKICLFGFSRGAYTARALAGMLFKVGLLPRDNQEQIPFAFKLYKRDDADGDRLSAGFKKTFCQDVKVEFMGVWETVSSVGVVMGKTLPFTSSNQAIKTFRQALALDEHRAKFRPNLYHRTPPDPRSTLFKHRTSANYGSVSVKPDETQRLLPVKQKGLFRRMFSGQQKYDRNLLDADEPGPPTDILEVWFCGCHSDVGGGAVPDATTQSLGNIPLRWMLRQVIDAGCGILFNADALARLLDVTPGSPQNSSDIPDSETNLDQADALEPIHDELKLTRLWWILEILPLYYTWQDAQGVWRSSYGINWGRGRQIEDVQPKFHASVKERMEAQALAYTPKATWTAGSEIYVE